MNHSTFEVAFPGGPKAGEDSAPGRGAKDAKGKQGRVTWCARALKCNRPADVTIREFKSPKLGGNPVQSFMANPRAAAARRGSPRATGWDHTSSEGAQRGGRGAGSRAGTPATDGDPDHGHKPRPQADTSTVDGIPATGLHPDLGRGSRSASPGGTCFPGRRPRPAFSPADTLLCQQGTQTCVQTLSSP